ncbi:cyclin-like protein [Wallemia mellicola]|uniref:Cyclin-like protein n=1 Tax=Wallemia mellicola TaxID=1708541 RepID=A0A4T0RNK5_9BASI|nr:cyclin-like protein [Wallemia mellicola]TIB85807.1 cyclin-like protein [Wallemia mellicola]TIB96091.1 cyclin-like protein [Wallemia mellicola]TIC21941.1 cyclin-like protein [Wallemia mellicola]TIC34103.1 cyclin-like protein [Wallemia mellicola]
MPDQWLFDNKEINETPSFKDGIDTDEEQKYRVNGVNWLLRIGVTARTYRRNDSLYNACTYFHRFYMRNSFADFEPEEIALTCLFLACKSQDSMKHVTHLAALAVYKRRTDIAKAEGKKPSTGEPMQIKDEPEVLKLQDSMLSAEIHLLRTLAFDLAIHQPFPLILDAARMLKLEKFDLVMMQAVLNDSMRTTICLSYPPNIIAMACFILPSAVSREMYLSETYRKVDWKDTHSWMSAFGFDVKNSQERLMKQQQQTIKRSRTGSSSPNSSNKKLKAENGFSSGASPADKGIDERLKATDPDSEIQESLNGKHTLNEQQLDVHIDGNNEITSKEVEKVEESAPVRDPRIENILVDVRDAMFRITQLFKFFPNDAREYQNVNKARVDALLASFPERPQGQQKNAI